MVIQLAHCDSTDPRVVVLDLMLMEKQLQMANRTIRQRKADQAPSSKGSLLYRSEEEQEMTRIVIEAHEDNNDPLQSFEQHSHYTPQPPRFIPDKQYKDFMLGRTSKRKESQWPSGPVCAGRCVGFSWIAVAFLVSERETMDENVDDFSHIHTSRK